MNFGLECVNLLLVLHELLQHPLQRLPHSSAVEVAMLWTPNVGHAADWSAKRLISACDVLLPLALLLRFLHAQLTVLQLPHANHDIPGSLSSECFAQIKCWLRVIRVAELFLQFAHVEGSLFPVLESVGRRRREGVDISLQLWVVDGFVGEVGAKTTPVLHDSVHCTQLRQKYLLNEGAEDGDQLLLMAHQLLQTIQVSPTECLKALLRWTSK